MTTPNNHSTRYATRGVDVGPLRLGGGEPIRVQGMANAPTRDVEAVLQQIERMTRRGCEMVRLAVPTEEDTAALPAILKQVAIPIIADVHFHYTRAIEAIEAGVQKIRLNPGNIQDRQQVNQVIDACQAHGTAIRIGVNQGSIVERRDKTRRSAEQQQNVVSLMVEKLAEYITLFESRGFEKLVLSAKCHDAARTIAVNRAIAERFDYPLHLGVTHAGDRLTGSIRSSVALGALLAEGIGDTLRVSLTADPADEIDVGWEILSTLGLRPRRSPELITCPTCGRTEIDIIGLANQVRELLVDWASPVTVAVMGCAVNGPGEADHADIALCGSRDKVVVYRSGQKIAAVPTENVLDTLREQLELLQPRRS